MRSLNRWLDRHLWVWAALLVILDAGFLIAVRPSRSPVGAVLSAVLFAGYSVWVTRRHRKRDLRAAGNQDADILELSRMMARGQVPDDTAQRDQMRGLLGRRRRQVRRARWIMPLFSLLLLLVAGLGIAMHSLVAALPLVALVVFFDGLALYGYRKQKRNLRRLDQRLS